MQKFRMVALCLAVLLAACDDRKHGCTDPNAINYDASAQVENGECNYPPNTQKVALFFFNDSQNNTCGTYGVPLFDQAITANTGKIVPIAVYPSSADTLFCPGGVSVTSAYGVLGYPDFGAGPQANLLTLNAINNAVNTAYNQTPTGNVDANFSIFGDTIKVDLYGKFFTADSASYFAVAYLLEDNVDQPQAGITDPNFRHDHVLRANTGGSGIGDQVNMDFVTSSTSFKRQYSIPVGEGWNTANMKIVAVLWRQTVSGFEFVNVNDQ